MASLGLEMRDVETDLARFERRSGRAHAVVDDARPRVGDA
jgi:hypothetical protein